MKMISIGHTGAAQSRTFAMRTRQGLQHRLRQFEGDERGSLLYFCLILFFLMLMMGGLAIDLMRHERVRTELQQTLDRAVLAAASLDQTLDPEMVVRDYFAKKGLTSYLKSVQVVDGANSRSVEAVAQADTKPFFLHLFGIDKMDAGAGSVAMQKINDVEIMLVLDVTGSMSGQKITDLKSAASDFVDTMLTDDPDRRVSIGLVPYNAQVNLGEVLRRQYDFKNEHFVPNSNCLEIPASSFNDWHLPNTLDLPMSSNADIFQGTYRSDGTTYVSWDATGNNGGRPDIPAGYKMCPPGTANVVQLPTFNATLLKSKINALVADGNTSIMTGMKWGLTLLAPEARPMYGVLAQLGRIPAEFAQRPFDFTAVPFTYDEDDPMKIIVLMTDGAHVSNNYVKDAYKSGLSPIYFNAADNRFSIFHATRVGTSKFWVPHNGTWQATKWGANSVQLDWYQVWSRTRASWVAWQLYARAMGTSSGTRNSIYNNQMNEIMGVFASSTTMDSRLQQSCNLARQKGIVVFTIAFQAPVNGQAQLLQCATNPNYYKVADATMSISDVFAGIASEITKLKLMQ